MIAKGHISYGILLSFVLVSITFMSCHHADEENEYIENSYPWGPIYPINLCQVSSELRVNLLHNTSNWQQLSIYLAWDYLDLDMETALFLDAFSEEIKSALSGSDYRKRLQYLQHQTDKARALGLEYYPFIIEWLDARVETGITVTADKPLFGRVPGTNLADYFSASAYICFDSKTDPEVSYTSTNYIIYSYPDFEVVKAFSAVQPASNLTELFLPHTAAVPRCIVQLNKIPDEEYDEITFTFSLSLSGESLLNYSTVPISKPYDKTINKTLQGSVTVSFR